MRSYEGMHGGYDRKLVIGSDAILNTKIEDRKKLRIDRKPLQIKKRRVLNPTIFSRKRNLGHKRRIAFKGIKDPVLNALTRDGAMGEFG